MKYKIAYLIRTHITQNQTPNENQVWIPFEPLLEDVNPLETKSSGDGASNLKGATQKLRKEKRKRKCQNNALKTPQMHRSNYRLSAQTAYQDNRKQKTLSSNYSKLTTYTNAGIFRTKSLVEIMNTPTGNSRQRSLLHHNILVLRQIKNSPFRCTGWN